MERPLDAVSVPAYITVIKTRLYFSKHPVSVHFVIGGGNDMSKRSVTWKQCGRVASTFLQVKVTPGFMGFV